MKIAIVGDGPRAEAIVSLLSSAGHHDVARATESDSIQTPLVVLAGSRNGDGRRSARVGPQTVLLDAMDGRATLETERSLAGRYGTQRVVRALMVLPQAGANVLCCSDDAAAMTLVKDVLLSCGCVPTDRGPLSNLTELEPPDPRLDEQFDRLKDVNRIAEP